MSTLRLCTLTLIAVVLAVVLGASSAFAQGGQGAPPQGLNVNIINPLPVPVTLEGVNVTNEVTVRSADNPALSAVKFPFRTEVNSTTPGQPASLNSESYTVPSGQRLVIEYVDSRFLALGNPGSLQMRFQVSDETTGTATIFHTIGFSSESMRCTLSQVCGGIGKTVKIYVDEGHTVRAEGTLVTAAASGLTIFLGTLNGHLVDLP